MDKFIAINSIQLKSLPTLCLVVIFNPIKAYWYFEVDFKFTVIKNLVSLTYFEQKDWVYPGP